MRSDSGGAWVHLYFATWVLCTRGQGVPGRARALPWGTWLEVLDKGVDIKLKLEKWC